MHQEIIIRFPLFARIYAAVFGACFLAFGLFLFIRAIDNRRAVAVVMSLFFVAMPAAVLAQTLGGRARTIGNELHVRNLLIDHVFQRHEIHQFSVLQANVRLPMAQTIVVVLCTGRTLTVYASRRSPLGKQQLADWHAQLQNWLVAEQGT